LDDGWEEAVGVLRFPFDRGIPELDPGGQFNADGTAIAGAERM
jgi:hypothetical protein